MVAPFNQAWMLLKQRGHELNLPPPRIMGDNPARSLSPQDLTDARVDEATLARDALNDFDIMGRAEVMPSNLNTKNASRFLENRELQQAELVDYLKDALQAQGNEQFLQEGQRELDQQTLARMGQQPEADEMEAMGMPGMDETGMPMSRSIGGRGPAPSEGRAGSSGLPPVGSDDVSEDTHDYDPTKTREFGRLLNELGPLSNPFTQKPATTQHLENSLEDWAAGAGRKAGTPQRPMGEERFSDDMYEEIHGEPLHESNPAAHSIASTTLRASPRQQKRGQMDSGRAEFKRPDREGPIGMSPSQRMFQQMKQMDAQKESGF